jgi:hypothetical protein
MAAAVLAYQGIKPNGLVMGIKGSSATAREALGIRHSVVALLVASAIVASGVTNWDQLPAAAAMDARDRRLIAKYVQHIPNMFMSQ